MLCGLKNTCSTEVSRVIDFQELFHQIQEFGNQTFDCPIIFVSSISFDCRTQSNSIHRLRVRFFKKIQDWILKSERIRKRILRFFTKQINPRSLRSWSVRGTEESTPRVDSSVPLTHYDLKDLELICSEKKRKIRFRILSDLRIHSWIFFKETHP